MLVGAAILLVISACGSAEVPSTSSASLARAATSAASTPKLSTTPTPSTTPSPTPSVTRVTETEPVPFAAATIDDPTRPQGESVVTTVGVDGIRTIVLEVTTLRGAEVSRVVVSDDVTTPPVDEVTSVGTLAPPPAEPVPFAQPAGDCDPNYTGACVPIDSDVDCAGGSGNGPSYVQGPVQVVGSDKYKLDSDGDGVGCE